MRLESLFVIIGIESCKMDFLWLYFKFITAIGCLMYSQITVGNVTLPKAVLSTAIGCSHDSH